MGSRGVETIDEKKEIKVLVTGFVHDLPNTHITLTKASPIPVVYKTIRHVIPRLLFPASTEDQASHIRDTQTVPFADLLAARSSIEDHGKPLYDFILHIGMAAPRKYFTLESCAHRDGYIARDEAGETMEADSLWHDEYKSPGILKPGFDIEDVWKRWKSGLMGVDIRPSSDAGRFLCEFIYYTSLVEYWRRDHDAGPPVLFLHVPGQNEEVDIQVGRKVALGLIGAMVMSSRRGKDKGEAKEEAAGLDQ
ncbi:MAG: hypothetical protein Q9174_000402 [Haloplaca sp. 1 TL-2023]